MIDDKLKDSVLWNKTVEIVGQTEDLLTAFRAAHREWEQVYKVFEQEHQAVIAATDTTHVAYLNAQQRLEKLNELRLALFAFEKMADTEIEGQNEWQYLFNALGLKVTVRVENTS